MKSYTAVIWLILLVIVFLTAFAGTITAFMFVGFLPLPTQYIYQTQEVEVTRLVPMTPEPTMYAEPSQNANDLHTNPYPYPGPDLPYIVNEPAPYPTPIFGLLTPEAPQFQENLATAYPITVPTPIITPIPTSGYYTGEAHDLRIRQYGSVICIGRS